MRIFYLDARESVSGYYRLLLPGNTLRAQGLAQTINNHDLIAKFAKEGIEALGKASLRVLTTCQLVHMQQTSLTDGLWLFDAVKKHGIKLVVDTDDRCDCGTPGDDKTELRLSKWDDRREVWSRADAFTCSSEGLKVWLEREFPNVPVYVLPNMLDCPAPRWKIARRKVHTMVVGWSGADTHRSDLELLRPVLPAIAKRGDCEVQVQGYDPGFAEFSKHNGVRLDPNMYGFLDHYPKRIAEFKIGLCPVIDHPFNTEGKSDLKYLDYSMVGCATIASDRHPYANTIKHGKNGMLVSDEPQEWIDAITWLIENPDSRRAMASNAHHYVTTRRNIVRTAKLWARVYREVINHG